MTPEYIIIEKKDTFSFSPIIRCVPKSNNSIKHLPHINFQKDESLPLLILHTMCNNYFSLSHYLYLNSYKI